MYSEVKAIENTAYWKALMKILRTLYRNSGYSSMYGGELHNLRTSTTNEKVRAFHKQLYLPENLTIIIIGKISPEKFFAALKPFQENITSKPRNELFVKPWQTPVEKIRESMVTRVSKVLHII